MTKQLFWFSKKAPPGSGYEGLVSGTGGRDELDSIGLDTKNFANDLSLLAGCSLDEESVKKILKQNLGKQHTGRLIQVNEGNDGTNHTLTSGITMGTLDMPPLTAGNTMGTWYMPPPSTSPATASRTKTGHDPTDLNSPTTKAFYAKNPELEPVDEEVSTRTSNQSIQHEVQPQQMAVLQQAAPPIHSKAPIDSNVLSTQSEGTKDTTAPITSVGENVS